MYPPQCTQCTHVLTTRPIWHHLLPIFRAPLQINTYQGEKGWCYALWQNSTLSCFTSWHMAWRKCFEIMLQHIYPQIMYFIQDDSHQLMTTLHKAYKLKRGLACQIFFFRFCQLAGNFQSDFSSVEDHYFAKYMQGDSWQTLAKEDSYFEDRKKRQTPN